MTEMQALAQECYDRAKAEDRPTRDIAAELVAHVSVSLARAMAIEFLIDIVSRTQREDALTAERSAERRPTTHSHESPGRIPRRGSQARQDWETNTEEGRAWAAAEHEWELRTIQMLNGNLARALDRYTEDLKIEWTAELLSSSFALRDGTVVTWGEATADQHRERRKMFLTNAHVNMEGAARHEVAINELEKHGADRLIECVEAAR